MKPPNFLRLLFFVWVVCVVVGGLQTYNNTSTHNATKKQVTQVTKQQHNDIDDTNLKRTSFGGFGVVGFV